MAMPSATFSLLHPHFAAFSKYFGPCCVTFSPRWLREEATSLYLLTLSVTLPFPPLLTLSPRWLREEASTSTRENAMFSLQMAKERGCVHARGGVHEGGSVRTKGGGKGSPDS